MNEGVPLSTSLAEGVHAGTRGGVHEEKDQGCTGARQRGREREREGERGRERQGH